MYLNKCGCSDHNTDLNEKITLTVTTDCNFPIADICLIHPNSTALRTKARVGLRHPDTWIPRYVKASRRRFWISRLWRTHSQTRPELGISTWQRWNCTLFLGIATSLSGTSNSILCSLSLGSDTPLSPSLFLCPQTSHSLLRLVGLWYTVWLGA